MDMDAAGGAVTGGLIAGAVEKPTGKAGHAHSGVGSDCGSAVSGKFCSNCGQPTHVHRSLLHLGEEVLHGVMHFDARIWRTLPLLAFNPGRLTREWVQGMRTRYVSPLALFLFTVFLMFFILSFTGGVEPKTPVDVADEIVAVRATLSETRAALASIEAEIAANPDVPGQQIGLQTTRTAVAAQERRLANLETFQATGARPDGLVPGSWQAGLKDMTGDAKPTNGSGGGAKLLKKLQNPDLVLYKLQQTMYKYAFLLVPLSIPFVALLFLWKRGFTLYDHGVFVLYSLTFISILGMIVGAAFMINQILGGLTLTAVSLWIPVHMFLQLKGAYGLTVLSSLWRTFFLLNFCSFVIGLFTVAVVYLGLGL